MGSGNQRACGIQCFLRYKASRVSLVKCKVLLPCYLSKIQPNISIHAQDFRVDKCARLVWLDGCETELDCAIKINTDVCM